MKITRNKKLIFLLSTITLLFLIVLIYLVYFTFFESKKLNSNQLNARNYEEELNTKRGTIFDTNGKTLTYSEKNGDDYIRKNIYEYMYSNIIGYTNPNLGKTNIEAYYNNELLNITKNLDLISKLESYYLDGKEGKNIYLTINDKLQSAAWDILGKYSGSILVANPKTGKILAMISKPSFNINNLEENWEKIVESEDAVLINRSTQGLYRPGSIIKPVTAIALLRNNIDLNYVDTGTAKVADFTIKNFEDGVYGEMGLEKALNTSANTYFFEKSTKLTNQNMIDVLEDFGIGKEYEFPIARNKSIIPFYKNISDLEKANAAFGLGDLLVTPMDMLLVAMGLANDGVVYTPQIVDKIEGSSIQNIEPQILSNKIEKKYTDLLKEYLISTAKYNNYELKNGITLAGKSGTADLENGLYNTWYLGYAPAENPKYAIIVITEKTEDYSGSTAGPVAIDVLNYIFENIE